MRRVSWLGATPARRANGRPRHRREFGATLRFGPENGFGIHTALVPSLAFLSMHGRAEWLLDDYGVGAGFHYPTPFGETSSAPRGGPCATAQGVPSRERLRSRNARNVRSVGTTRAAPRSRTASHRSSRPPPFPSTPRPTRIGPGVRPARLRARVTRRPLGVARRGTGFAERRRSRRADGSAGRALRSGSGSAALSGSRARSPLAGTAALARMAAESHIDGCLGEGVAAARAAKAHAPRKTRCWPARDAASRATNRRTPRSAGRSFATHSSRAAPRSPKRSPRHAPFRWQVTAGRRCTGGRERLVECGDHAPSRSRQSTPSLPGEARRLLVTHA